MEDHEGMGWLHNTSKAHRQGTNKCSSTRAHRASWQPRGCIRHHGEWVTHEEVNPQAGYVAANGTTCSHHPTLRREAQSHHI